MSEHSHDQFNAGAPVLLLSGLLRGTLVETLFGARSIETIKLGDEVNTMDGGVQVVKSIGRQRAKGSGNCAPIRFEKGACGNTETLLLAPHQRVLITGWLAELYFGEDQVFVEARSLLNGGSVRREEIAVMELINLGFDTPQAIFANGAAVESDLPHEDQGFECAMLPRSGQMGSYFTAPAATAASGRSILAV